MKKTNIIASSLLLSALSVSAYAATSSTILNVNASVGATCNVATGPVNFGFYNPTQGQASDANGDVTATCTSGTPYSIGLGAGQSGDFAQRTMRDGANPLAYSLYTDSSYLTVWDDTTNVVSGVGTGFAQSITVFGRILAGQTNVTVGNYSDIVAVTITY